MGQAPQLLRQAGIDVALFGRGVKPVGFDNQVLGDDQFQSTFSEMIWEGQMAVRFWAFYLLTGTAMAMKSQLMRRKHVFSGRKIGRCSQIRFNLPLSADEWL